MSIDAEGLTLKLRRCPCPISNVKIDSRDVENYSYFEWNLKLVVYLPIILITSVRTPTKVIIHKSCGGVSLVEQDTIEYVSWSILKASLNFRKLSFFYLHFMQLFSADAKMFFEFFLILCDFILFYAI